MKALKYFSVIFAGFFIFIACQKELSVESGYAGKTATGSLLDTAGNCKNIAVSGTYITDSTLNTNNYVTVQVNFATGGSYKVFTDTQNGFSFQDSGYLGAGLQSIKLKATGKPILAKETTFQVAFDTTFCSFTVTVIGSAPAAYTLVGSPNSCSNSTINGAYTTGVALNNADSVTLEVAVTTIGSYSIQTPAIKGISFSGSGNITNTGLQIITLHGSGMPTVVGNDTIPVTAGSSNCSFIIPVADGNISVNPNNSDTAWSFTEGTKNFSGPFYDVYDTTINSTYGLVFIGLTPSTTDTVLYFGNFFTGTSIQTGSYSTRNFAAFSFTDYRDTANPAAIYTANPNTSAVNTQINIAAYDNTTKIITGSFSGTVLNASNVSVPITNGRFKARVRIH